MVLEQALIFSKKIQLFCVAPVATIWTETDNRVLFRNCRKVQMSPTSDGRIAQAGDADAAWQMHDDDDRALALVIASNLYRRIFPAAGSALRRTQRPHL